LKETYPLAFKVSVKRYTRKTHMFENLEDFRSRTSSQKDSHTEQKIPSWYLGVGHDSLTAPCVHLLWALRVGTTSSYHSLCSNLLGLQFWIFCFTYMAEFEEQ